MRNLKSHFTFNKNERSGILLLISLIIGLLLVLIYYNPEQKSLLDSSSSEVAKLQKEIDSLRNVKSQSAQLKIYPFNPNFITDYKAYTLGLSPSEFDKLQAFRKKNKWINSKEDFQRVTGVSDTLLNRISSYFKFPDWIANPQSPKRIKKDYSINKSYAQKQDLNIATQLELEKIYGIGEKLSQRIIAYREKLGGFSDDIQLNNVYGLNKQTVSKVLEQFTVKSPKRIIKMDINKVSASDIATIPGVSFDLAKNVWEFVRLRERITNLSELKKIEDITVDKFELIQLYLSVE